MSKYFIKTKLSVNVDCREKKNITNYLKKFAGALEYYNKNIIIMKLKAWKKKEKCLRGEGGGTICTLSYNCVLWSHLLD